MKIKIQNELIIIDFLVLVLILGVTFIPSSAIRIVLGLPFLLFFPGYTLIATLFPKKTGMDGIERIALSFGMSIAVVPLIGLLLNYTSWGIRLVPVLYSVSLFIFTTSVIAWFRRRRISEQERFVIEFETKNLGWSGSKLDKALSLILAISILGTIGVLIFVFAFPKVGEKFSEFYILGLNGKAADYPKELKVDGTAKVIVGIVNHEQKTVSYWIEIRINDIKDNEAGPVVLDNEGKWEQTISFTPDTAGENQQVEFLLYKDGGTQYYLETHLWIDVVK